MNARKLRGLTLLAVLALPPACDTADDVEVSDHALSTRDKDVPVSHGIVRKERVTCGRRCAQWVLVNNKAKSCKRWEDDCSQFTVPQGAVLYADDGARATNNPFPAFDDGTGHPYVGCGPEAVQNVLEYFGARDVLGRPITMDIVTQFVKTSNWGGWSKGLGSYPEWVRDGLQNLLNAFADGNYTVTVKSWTDVGGTLRSELKAGNPVIVLANGGSHYLTAVGYDGPDFWVVDYPWNGPPQKVAYGDLGTEFFDGGDFISDLHGWKSQTVITIHKNW
jgi:hypothetical protein